MAFQTDPTLSPEEQAAAVDDAHKHLAAGASARKASDAAGARYGVSGSTIRRYAARLGRPLRRVSAETEAATRTRLLMNAQKQRRMVQDLLAVTEKQIAAVLEQAPEERDPVHVDRLSRQVARLSATDRGLLMALGPGRGESFRGTEGEPPAPEPPAAEAREAPPAEEPDGLDELRELLDQHRRDVAKFKGEAL